MMCGTIVAEYLLQTNKVSLQQTFDETKCVIAIIDTTFIKVIRMQFLKHISLSTIYSIALILFCISFTLVAKESEHTRIQLKTEEFVKQHLLNENDESIQIRVKEIDHRVKLANCSEPYLFESPNFDANKFNTSVKVSCPNTNWFVFVNVTIKKIQQVAVASDSLSPGSLLTANNIHITDIDTSRVRGSTFDNIELIEGARIKRRVRPGTVLSASMLCFVCKGDRVTISAVSGGLSIKVFGLAEQDGTLGDTIKVRNASSDRIVYATVAGANEVVIQI